MSYPILFGNMASSGSSGGTNYYGDGSSGSVTYSTNTSLVVPNKVGSYDGDMVVMNYTDLTINSGVTLTTDQPGRGLLIYVQGNCNINGTLSMKGRGPYANPTIGGASDGNAVSSSGLQIPFRTELGSSSLTPSTSLFNGAGNAARTAISNHTPLNGNGTVLTLVRQGAAGGARTGGGTPISPNPGSNGSIGQTGGGGSGGGYYNESQAGAGSYGSCFGGGSGGGGTHGSSTTPNATAWGGPGGNGGTPNGGYDTPGGMGNPNGTWGSTGTQTSSTGRVISQNGTGGLIILVVGGTLTLGGQGLITADGSTDSIYSDTTRAGGGASGGGNIVLAYKTAFINNGGSVSANGGARWGWGDQAGAAGGNGSVQTLQIL
jgi:hypothetical protein